MQLNENITSTNIMADIFQKQIFQTKIVSSFKKWLIVALHLHSIHKIAWINNPYFMNFNVYDIMFTFNVH